MTRSASRSLFTLALLLLPAMASAQATQTPPATRPATPPVVKPATPVASTMARPATAAAQVAKPATAAATAPATKPPTTPATASAVKPATAAAARTAPARDANGRFMKKSAAATTVVHATCKDGTTWEGAQRSGACARHGGVKAWN